MDLITYPCPIPRNCMNTNNPGTKTQIMRLPLHTVVSFVFDRLWECAEIIRCCRQWYTHTVCLLPCAVIGRHFCRYGPICFLKSVLATAKPTMQEMINISSDILGKIRLTKFYLFCLIYGVYPTTFAQDFEALCFALAMLSGPFLLTSINFNPSIDNQLRPS